LPRESFHGDIKKSALPINLKREISYVITIPLIIILIFDSSRGKNGFLAFLLVIGHRIISRHIRISVENEQLLIEQKKLNESLQAKIQEAEFLNNTLQIKVGEIKDLNEGLEKKIESIVGIKYKRAIDIDAFSKISQITSAKVLHTTLRKSKNQNSLLFFTLLKVLNSSKEASSPPIMDIIIPPISCNSPSVNNIHA